MMIAGKRRTGQTGEGDAVSLERSMP